MDIKKILEEIKSTPGCELLPIIKSNYEKKLPDDLEYFFKNYGGINFFIDMPYGITVVGAHDFKNSNAYLFPEDDIIWEELDGDISNDWFIIAKSENLSQYISIDLNDDRLGHCYDSFIETHANPESSPIIAKSFTELLKKILDEKGVNWYWLAKDFENYGDAYENE